MLSTKTRNPLNEYYTKEFSKLRKEAERRHQEHLASSYSKVIKSIIKYPLPIFKKLQIGLLEGVGPNMEKEFERILDKRETEICLQLANGNESEEIYNMTESSQIFSSHMLQSEYSNLNSAPIHHPNNLGKGKKRRIGELGPSATLPPVLRRKPNHCLKGNKSSNWIYLVSLYLAKLHLNQPRVDKTSHIIPMFTLLKDFMGNKLEIDKLNDKSRYLITNKYLEEGENKNMLMLTETGLEKAKELLDYEDIDVSLFPNITENEKISYNIELRHIFRINREVEWNVIEERKEVGDEIKDIVHMFKSRENIIVKRVKEEEEKKMSYSEGWNVTVLLDNREIKSKKDRDYIYNCIIENGIPCTRVNLPIGDLVWAIRYNLPSSNINKGRGTSGEMRMLGYIAERKKADDLGASIYDGRYGEQKYKLKSAGIPNVIYIVEGEPSANCVIPMRALQTAIINTKVITKFQLLRTSTLHHTIRWISNFTQYLTSYIKDNQFPPFHTLMTYQQFFARNNRITVKSVFTSQLELIHKIGGVVVKAIQSIFKTPSLFHKALKECKDKENRIELINMVHQEYIKDNTITLERIKFLRSPLGQSTAVRTKDKNSIKTRRMNKTTIEMIEKLYTAEKYD